MFWSWQSDTPGKTGPFLVRDVLKDAIDKLKQTSLIEEPIAKPRPPACLYLGLQDLPAIDDYRHKPVRTQLQGKISSLTTSSGFPVVGTESTTLITDQLVNGREKYLSEAKFLLRRLQMRGSRATEDVPCAHPGQTI